MKRACYGLAMLTLIQYPPAFGTRSGSPFCTKVEVLLKMSGKPFQIEIWNDPRKAPKKKLPVLRDGNTLVADSTFIRQHLEQAHDCDFDAGLSPSERAVAAAFTKLTEEHLYWCIMYMRWWEEDNWAKLKNVYFESIPKLVRAMVVPAIRKQTRVQLEGHGMGLHSGDEIYQLGTSDIRSIADFLADKPYFMGEKTSAVDATVYAFIASIIDCELPGVLKDEAQKHSNLSDYCARMRQQLFSN